MKFEKMRSGALLSIKRNLGVSCAILICLGLTSCSDLIEEDLEDENITLLSPPINQSTTTSTITFWWEELDGADEIGRASCRERV